jgi:alkylation response protein AidB-like acyl-CoA dehydrogenase
MAGYQPPLRDLRFVLHEVLGAQAVLAEMPRYAGVDADLFDSLAEQAGRFSAEQVAPLNLTADAVGCRYADGQVSAPPGFAAAYAAYRELGWPGVCAEEEHGGQALPRLAFSLVNEMQAAASHAFVMYSAVNHCAAACLRHSASDELQALWLPRLASGEVLASMCMTEPQAGSDIGLLRTTATAHDDGTYRLSGAKIFASGAEHDLTDNVMHLVLARVRGAPAGSRGLSLFIVPKRLPGGSLNTVHCDGIEHKMGLHGSATCSLRFEAAQGWLVGDENFGLRAMFPMMNEARLLSGLQSVGLSDAALQKALAYAHDRRQGRSPSGEQPCAIVAHPDVQRMLMTQKAWTEGGRAFVHWVALLIDVADWHPDAVRRRDAELLTGLLTPLVKGFLTENAQTSISLALQVHGGHGYVHETGVEQLARDARITTIYEGTTGIQAQDLLLRKVLADEGQRLQVLEAEVQRWLDGPGRRTELGDFARPLAELLEEVRELTGLLAQRERAAPGSALSASVHYLRLLGHLVLALLWARMAEAALAGEGAWHRAKLATARFHCGQLLPEVRHLAFAIRTAEIDFSEALSP